MFMTISRWGATALAICSILAGNAWAQEAMDDVDTFDRVSGWSIKDDGDKGCFATRELQRKKWVSVAPNTSKFRGLVQLQSITWDDIVKEGDYPVQFIFEGGSVLNLSMAGSVGPELDWEGNHQFLSHIFRGAAVETEMKRSRILVIQLGGRTMGTVPLKDIDKVFASVIACEAQH